MKKHYLCLMEHLVDHSSLFLRKYIISRSENMLEIIGKSFYYTSKFTYFFFFDNFGKCLYFLCHIIVFIHNGQNFTYVYYATLHNGWNTFFTNLVTYLNWDFFLLLGFLGVLSELSFNNTVLISIPEVKQKIIQLYGDEFPKQVGYNSRFTTLTRNGERLFVFGVSVGAAFVGAAAGQIHESDVYRENYKDYLSFQSKSPNITISPPQRSSLLKFPFLKN